MKPRTGETCSRLLHPLHCLLPSHNPQNRSNWDHTSSISVVFPSKGLGGLNSIDLSPFLLWKFPRCMSFSIQPAHHHKESSFGSCCFPSPSCRKHEHSLNDAAKLYHVPTRHFWQVLEVSKARG